MRLVVVGGLGSTPGGREQGVSQVILTSGEDREIRVGSRVRVRDADGEDEFTIVPECEADAFADRVSVESPFGRAPAGIVGVTVVAVS
jgi:transcription elongation GreA/GreB family factor